jgi:hypothetical protein
MLEWKVRQEIYHKLNTGHDDDLSLHNIELTENIIHNAIKYFTTTELGWVYPAKSYVVGICYAKWLKQYFAEDFYDALNDSNLLFGNDPYFVPYEKDKNTYDTILNNIGFDFDETLGIIPDIKKYFIEEFLIDYE